MDVVYVSGINEGDPPVGVLAFAVPSDKTEYRGYILHVDCTVKILTVDEFWRVINTRELFYDTCNKPAMEVLQKKRQLKIVAKMRPWHLSMSHALELNPQGLSRNPFDEVIEHDSRGRATPSRAVISPESK